MTLTYSKMHFKMFKSRVSLTLGPLHFKIEQKYPKANSFEKYFLLFLNKKAYILIKKVPFSEK